MCKLLGLLPVIDYLFHHCVSGTVQLILIMSWGFSWFWFTFKDFGDRDVEVFGQFSLLAILRLLYTPVWIFGLMFIAAYMTECNN